MEFRSTMLLMSVQARHFDNLEVGFPASMAGMNTDKVIDILSKTIIDCKDS